TYYDDYNWRNNSDSLYFTSNEIVGQESNFSARTIGLTTGGKIKVLDGGTWGGVTWLSNVTYYDDRQRVIQTVAGNYKAGTDRTTNVVDFVGRILQTKTTQESYDVTWTDRTSVTSSGNKSISVQTI